MKKFLVILFLAVPFIATAFAVSLAWDDPEDDTLKSYNVYEDGGQTPVASIPAPATQWLIPQALLPPGAHTFSITSVDTLNRESGHSNVATVPALPSAPTGLHATP